MPVPRHIFLANAALICEQFVICRDKILKSNTRNETGKRRVISWPFRCSGCEITEWNWKEMREARGVQ